MSRLPRSDRNAEYAVRMFTDLMSKNGWGRDKVWLAIAQLLITCEVWQGKRVGWSTFYDLPVLRESNDYELKVDGSPNLNLEESALAATYLAQALGVSSQDLCQSIGLFFKESHIAPLQPNNPRGHAFRSIIAQSLSDFGDSALNIEEEISAYDLFPGHTFSTRSKNARIDIIARRGDRLVALLTTRWTFRHDRVDIIEEAMAYVPAARRLNANCRFIALTSEMVDARLKKVIAQSRATQPTAALDQLIHISPHIAGPLRNRNGDLTHLRSIEWMLEDSFNWK